jgi:uncharacterized membrane protein
MTLTTRTRLQLGVRWLTAGLFMTVGVLHFTHHSDFVSIMPAYVPWHGPLVWASGVFEILGGIGLLVPATRRFAAWGLLALLIAVFPANVNMAVNQIYVGPEWIPQSPVGLYLRLPMQLVLMAQVWVAGLWALDEGA